MPIVRAHGVSLSCVCLHCLVPVYNEYAHDEVLRLTSTRLQFKLLNVVDTPNKYELPLILEVDKLERSLAFCMPNTVLLALGFRDDGIRAADKLQVLEDVDILCRIEEELVSLRRGILKRQRNYQELLELFRTTVSDEHKLRKWADLCDAPIVPSSGAIDAFRPMALSAIAVRMRAHIAQLEVELTAVDGAVAKLHGGTVRLAAASGDPEAAAMDELNVPTADTGAAAAPIAAAAAPITAAAEEDAGMGSTHSADRIDDQNSQTNASQDGTDVDSASVVGPDGSDSGSGSHSGSDSGNESADIDGGSASETDDESDGSDAAM